MTYHPGQAVEVRNGKLFWRGTYCLRITAEALLRVFEADPNDYAQELARQLRDGLHSIDERIAA
jgi:lipoate-protein ligase A